MADDVNEIMHELSMRYLHKYTARVKEEIDFATERAAWSRLCMSMSTKELQHAFSSWFATSNSEKNDWPPVPDDILRLAKSSRHYDARKKKDFENKQAEAEARSIQSFLDAMPDKHKTQDARDNRTSGVKQSFRRGQLAKS